MITHKLKIKEEYFDSKIDGKKPFEVRKNDRDFKAGDRVIYLDPKTGDPWVNRFFEILYVTDFEQKEGYVVFSDKLIWNW